MTTAVYAGLGLATLACVLVNAFEVVAKLRGAQFVVRNSSELGVPVNRIPYLAAVEGSGTVGMMVGLVGVLADLTWLHLLGLAAAAGLVLFFTIATGTHAAKRVLHNIAFPITFLVLACCAVGLFALTATAAV